MKRFLILMVAVLSVIASATRADDRPNILFCIADDWGWPHAGAYGDAVVKTPTFDRIAREGVLFKHAYVSSPSCTPCRSALLTGQYHWRLKEAANLWSTLRVEFPVYPLLLEKAGYHVGYWRKSWGPGKLSDGGYKNGMHPAGKHYRGGLQAFLDERPDGKPFCFWLGASDPHRGYKLGSGRDSGMDIDKVEVPGFYPNTETVRSDIADYYFEVQRFDGDVGKAIQLLEDVGELENTIVVVTGDHGMPFPRCKTHLYDMGVRVPLAVRVGKEVKSATIAGPGRTIEDFVSLIDLAPTFLEAAGVEVPGQMTGRSLLPVLATEKTGEDGFIDAERDHVIYGRERHVPCRPDHTGYPCRGIRTAKWAYIRNYHPERWPAGDPPFYGDCDPHNSVGKNLTKGAILEGADTPEGRKFYAWSFGKRPAEELYDMENDPDQLKNLAEDPKYATIKAELIATLEGELKATKDPRIIGGAEQWDKYPYYGGGAWKKPNE